MISEYAKDCLTGLIGYMEEHRHHLVIDGDTHPTDLNRLEGPIRERFESSEWYYQGRPISAEQLLKGMDSSGIDMSVIWQNPAAFAYTGDKHWNFSRLLEANRDIAGFARQHPKRFIPAGWTDPKSLGLANAIELVRICVEELGFCIVKMNPAQNGYPIDSDDVFKIVQSIIMCGATPAFHFGGDSPYTPASGLERIAREFPDNPIIGVHMGGGGSHFVEGDQTYLDARELGLKCPNLFYIISAKRDAHIESDLLLYTRKGRPFNENMAWGSDAPYGLQSWTIGGFRKLLETLSAETKDNGQKTNPFTREVLNNYMGANLAMLIIKSCRCVLKENGRTFARPSSTHFIKPKNQ